MIKIGVQFDSNIILIPASKLKAIKLKTKCQLAIALINIDNLTH